MRKKQYIFTILVLVLVSLILGFSGCSNPFQTGQGDGDGQSRSEPDMGNLTVAFGAELARTSVLPDFSGLLQSYVLTAEKDGTTISETRSDVGTTQLSGLSYGTWTVTVEGMSGADGSGDVLAIGSTDVLIDQASNSVNIELAFLRAEGQGDIQLTITVPTSSGVTRITSQFAGGSQTDMSITESSGSSEVVFSETNLASGEHDLIIRFYTGEAGSYVSLGNPLVLLVHVFGNISTEKTIAVDETQLNTTPDAPVSLSATAASGGAELTWTDNSYFETGYVVERRPEGGSWTEVAQLGANAEAWSDTTISTAEHDRYQYRVVAENAIGTSGYANGSVVNTVGYMHPVAGSFAPVTTGGTGDYGWSDDTWPKGAHFSGSDLEFAVYSKNAERILLEIYSSKHLADAGSEAAAWVQHDYWMEKGGDNIWRAKLTSVPEGALYAFRVWGPNWPWDSGWTRGHSAAGYISDVDAAEGHRFNPNKLLTDPYAYELSHDTLTEEFLQAGENGGIYGTGGTDVASQVDSKGPADFEYSGPITGNIALDRRMVDTAIWAPKSVAVDTTTAYTGIKPNIPGKDVIKMETHLRGLTKHPSTESLRTILTDYSSWFDDFSALQNIPTAYRGTYKGAAYMAPYLKALGINVVEFLPVHETRNDMNDLFTDSAGDLIDETVPNFWGYMTYSFFAPDRRYAYDQSYGGPTQEFKEMVEAFNAAGIEVWLDVVYNHTGEGGNWGDAFTTGFNSYGGFDTAEYYHLNPFDKRWIETGATGTGNQMNFSRQVNHDLVIDSLTYWIDSMGVSGFRFDLAAVLGRDPDLHEGKDATTYWDDVKTFYPNHPTLLAIRDLGTNRSAKMVAEAWDIWGYPVGLFPSGWGEWNGRYRDATRKFLLGDPSGHGGISLNDAFHGDYTYFGPGSSHPNEGPHKSINFLVAHDGFTLADLVSYNNKLNQHAYPFGPSNGGSDNNDSWDSTGGPAGLAIQELRRQRWRNFWVFQFFSRGTPMVVYGDEFGRTQNGNNNPYNLDSPATWNNYNMINTNEPQGVSVHPDFAASYHNNLGQASTTDPGYNPLLDFARSVIQLRVNEPALRQDSYDMTIEYAKADGSTVAGTDRARRMHLHGSEVTGGSDYVLFINMWEGSVDFSWPTPPTGTEWRRIIDTAHWAEAGAMNTWDDAAAEPAAGASYGVNPWSIVVFKAVPQP